MEPESTLPRSQVPANCPYPEPARSIPCPTYHFIKIHFNITFPSAPGFSKWSRSLRFSHQNPVYVFLLPIRAICSAQHIMFGFITRTVMVELYRSLSYHYVVFSIPRYLVPLRPKYSPQHHILKYPQPTFLPQYE